MKKIAVLSGKGGVGKTTVSIHLAKKLALHYRVALVGLDITMENLREEMKGEIDACKDKLIPIKEGNLEAVYYTASEKSEVTWDYEDYEEATKQLIHNTQWNNPQYIILDLPPGNDVITLSALPMSDCTIIVFQAHPYSVSNAQRILELCRDENIPIAGAIKNFTYLNCPSCGTKIDVFNEKAELEEVPVIAEIPFCNSIEQVQNYFDIDTLLKRINNPIKLKRRNNLRAKFLKFAFKGGAI